jgi:hypothetical protein
MDPDLYHPDSGRPTDLALARCAEVTRRRPFEYRVIPPCIPAWFTARLSPGNSPLVATPDGYGQPLLPRLLPHANEASITVKGQHQLSTLSGTDREQTRKNTQTAIRQKPEFTGPFKIRTSPMTCSFYRTSSPVTALPMIMRWMSDVPSKIVKLIEVRAVSAARWRGERVHVSTSSAPFVRSPLCGYRKKADPVSRCSDNEP